MVRALFVMEQHLGHAAFSQNLRRFIGRSGQIDKAWVDVTYTRPACQKLSFPDIIKHLCGIMVGRWQVRQGLRRYRPDIVFYNTQVPAVLGGDLVKRTPYLACTDITPIQYDQMAGEYGHRADSPGLLKDWKHSVNTHLFQQAARLLPWSNWAAASLAADYGVNQQVIEVFPPGVDLEVWCPAPPTPRRAVRILFVGGDFYRKGGSLLLEAFSMLPAGMAELALVTRSAVPTQEGVVVYQNMRPNSPQLVALYQSSDVFTLPTRAEAFGISAVEASATGLPVVSTAVGGLTDIVVHGETGMLLRTGDPRELADHLYALAGDSDLRRRLGAAARSRAESKFDARKNTARLENIIFEVFEH
jgi:glycosyltransferase involved in cell wall biosynthesis